MSSSPPPLDSSPTPAPPNPNIEPNRLPGPNKPPPSRPNPTGSTQRTPVYVVSAGQSDLANHVFGATQTYKVFTDLCLATATCYELYEERFREEYGPPQVVDVESKCEDRENPHCVHVSLFHITNRPQQDGNVQRQGYEVEVRVERVHLEDSAVAGLLEQTRPSRPKPGFSTPFYSVHRRVLALTADGSWEEVASKLIDKPGDITDAVATGYEYWDACLRHHCGVPTRLRLDSDRAPKLEWDVSDRRVVLALDGHSVAAHGPLDMDNDTPLIVEVDGVTAQFDRRTSRLIFRSRWQGGSPVEASQVRVQVWVEEHDVHLAQPSRGRLAFGRVPEKTVHRRASRREPDGVEHGGGLSDIAEEGSDGMQHMSED